MVLTVNGKKQRECAAEAGGVGPGPEGWVLPPCADLAAAGGIAAPRRSVSFPLNGGHGHLALRSVGNEILLFLSESATPLRIPRVLGGNVLGACWRCSECWKPGPRLRGHGHPPGQREETAHLGVRRPRGAVDAPGPKGHFWGVGPSGVLVGRGPGTPQQPRGSGRFSSQLRGLGALLPSGPFHLPAF